MFVNPTKKKINLSRGSRSHVALHDVSFSCYHNSAKYGAWKGKAEASHPCDVTYNSVGIITFLKISLVLLL